MLIVACCLAQTLRSMCCFAGFLLPAAASQLYSHYVNITLCTDPKCVLEPLNYMIAVLHILYNTTVV